MIYISIQKSRFFYKLCQKHCFIHFRFDTINKNNIPIIFQLKTGDTMKRYTIVVALTMLTTNLMSYSNRAGINKGRILMPSHSSTDNESKSTDNESKSTDNKTKSMGGSHLDLLLLGHGGGKSGHGMGPAAAMGAMASGGQNSGGSGSSGSGSGSSDPSTPSTPAPTPAASPVGVGPSANSGAPTSVPSSTPSSNSATPASDTPSADNTNTEKSADKTADTTSTDVDKKTPDATLLEENKTTITDDQADILAKLQSIDMQDKKNHMLLTLDSMNQLFNNFVYFKDFIIHNFSKDQMLSLCTELINQIYPVSQLPAISTVTTAIINKKTQTSTVNPAAAQSATSDTMPTAETTSSDTNDSSSDENNSSDTTTQTTDDLSSDNTTTETSATSSANA